MTVTSGSVNLEKDDSNLIGISIGGGAKYCPCLYVVQVILEVTFALFLFFFKDFKIMICVIRLFLKSLMHGKIL